MIVELVEPYNDNLIVVDQHGVTYIQKGVAVLDIFHTQNCLFFQARRSLFSGVHSRVFPLLRRMLVQASVEARSKLTLSP